MLALVCAPGTPAAGRSSSKGPRRIDISAVAEHLWVFTDGKGHYLATVPLQARRKHRILGNHDFYGDGKRMYRLKVSSASSGGGGFSLAIPDPRLRSRRDSRFVYKDGVGTMHCGKRRARLRRLPVADALALVRRARFFERYFARRAFFLGRDFRGRYYYVDRLPGRTTPYDVPRGARLFIGPKGRLKRTKLDDVVSDPAGVLLITDAGSLKLDVKRKSKGLLANIKIGRATWITGPKKQLALTVVDLDNLWTRYTIFSSLGVYMGKRLWLPCEDL